MHFLNPWLLLGMMGVAIPIVIHLLNRYRYRQIDWGAMDLLRRALIVRSRRVRIEDLILLALRCLAVLLIALALARPTVTPEGAPWIGGQADVGVVVALDASYSMEHRPGVQSRFDRGSERVRDVLKSLKSGSPTTLVLLGDRPRVLLRNVGYDADRFEEALKSANVRPERLNLELCLDELNTLLGEIKAPVRECFLISDAQANSWGRLSDRARQKLGQIEENGRIFYLPVAFPQVENAGLTHFELKSGFLRRRALARYEAEVRNWGVRPRENVSVRLYLNEQPVDQAVIQRLEPGKAATVPLFARFDREGIARLSARLSMDELPADNARHAVADIRARTRVLYVSPALNDGKGEVDYLLLNLQPRPTEALAIDAISWLDLPSKRLSDYHLILLSNIPDLPDEQVRNLYHFVKQGGGLMMVLGDNVQPAVLNARLQTDGVSLLPAQIQAGVGEVSEEAPGRPLDIPDHPMARVLALSPELLKDARVQRYFPMRVGEGGRAVLKLAGGETIVAEKPVGRGRVVAFGVMADRHWTNMVKEPGFYLMLLHETITHLSRQVYERPITVAGALTMPLPATDDAATTGVQFREPSGKSLTVAPVRREGQRLAELGQAEQPGFYEVRYSPDAPPLIAAVNVDPQEGDLRTLQNEQLDETFQGLKVRRIEEADDVAAVVRESRIGRELWKELLLLGIVVLLVETFLAHWFTRRLSSAPGSEVLGSGDSASAPGSEDSTRGFILTALRD